MDNALTADKDQGGQEKPENFAKLVTNNYDVVAHYKDRAENKDQPDYDPKESGFSGTLFVGKDGAGRFVNAADSKMVKNFMAINI